LTKKLGEIHASLKREFEIVVDTDCIRRACLPSGKLIPFSPQQNHLAARMLLDIFAINLLAITFPSV